MREIRFRAWDKHHNEMDYWDCDDGDIGFWDAANKFSNLNTMQFTGLKDKNGVEIYESDLVILPFQSSKNMIFQIYFDERRSMFLAVNTKDAGVTRFFNDGGSTYEVIGNIHENPELLKEK